MNRVIHKHELVAIAADLFRMKGYAGTSIDDVARACGLTKGSLYHHFSGKEELALAALEQVHQHYRERIFSIIADEPAPSPQTLAAFNAAVEEFFQRHPHGCLLANLSLEGGSAAGPFQARIRLFFDEWLACYVKVFAQAAGAAESSAMAEDALAIVHGCILMNRIRADLAPLRRQHGALIAMCRQKLAA